MTKNEAMKLALVRLQARTDTSDLDAIGALIEALAEQPAQQEPVGEVMLERMGIGDAQVVRFQMYKEIPPVGTKLYTSPPAQRKPLTDDVIQECWYKTQGDAELFARAIETALNIKENT